MIGDDLSDQSTLNGHYYCCMIIGVWCAGEVDFAVASDTWTADFSTHLKDVNVSQTCW